MEIPKKLHQIWLGGPMPEKFCEYARRWRELHPTWEYRLWEEKDLAWLEHAEDFARVPQYATKANIARYEIIARFGGIYIDTDFEPLKALDSLIDGASMIVCPEQPRLLANGFFAATPNHPVLTYVLSQLRESIEANRAGTSPEMCGPVFFTRAVRRGMAVTGADCRWVERQCFYPYNYDQEDLGAMPGFAGAFAVHRWAKSWVAPPQPQEQGSLLREKLHGLTKQAATRAVQMLERLRKPQPRLLNVGPNRILVDVQGRFSVLVPADDLNLLPQLFANGISDLPYLEFLARFLRPSDHVVDIGANIGYTVLAAATRLGPYGRVDAFEPNPTARGFLEDNIYMNRMLGMAAQVRVHSCAVGASAARLTLKAPCSHRGRASLNPVVHAKFASEGLACEEAEVIVKPLADAIGDVTKIRLIKVDVEGYEAEVLQGLMPFIESGRVDCIDVELIDELAGPSWATLEHLLRDMVDRLHARCYKIREDGTLERVNLASVLQGPALSHLLLRFDEAGSPTHTAQAVLTRTVKVQ
jgi:FkbM family methyltransferase